MLYTQIFLFLSFFVFVFFLFLSFLFLSFCFSDTDRFVRFVNGILNHTNALITDSLSRLPTIRQIQREMEDVVAWTTMDEVKKFLFF